MRKFNLDAWLKGKKTSIILALLVMFFWGSLFPMIKIGYRTFDIDTANIPSILFFAGIRFLLCGIVLLVLSARQSGKIELPDRTSVRPILTIALFAYILHYTCTYVGISKLDGSKAAILKQVGTLFIVCFAFLFRKEDKFTYKKLLGGLLGFASILVVNFNGKKWEANIYDLIIIAASVCSAINTVLSKNAYDHHKPLFITGWAQLIGGIVLLGIGLISGGNIGKFDFSSLLVLIYICFASCMAYALWNLLLKHQNMSSLNTIRFAETLFSSICSWILLGENIFRFEFVLSVILVCVGIIICNMRETKKHDKSCA